MDKVGAGASVMVKKKRNAAAWAFIFGGCVLLDLCKTGSGG